MNLVEYLLKRRLNPPRYQLTLDEKERIITFYLFNLSGRIVGYQQHRPDSMEKKMNCPKEARYYTYLPEKTDGFFGLECCTFPSSAPLYVVEGVFKAATLHSLGYDAIAVLTSDPKRLRPLFRILRHTRPVIGIGDNDAAGQKLVDRVGRGSVSPADLDEMSAADVVKFIGELK